MRLVLLGLPGAGKGTQAKLLVERRGLTYIGTGDILRDAIANNTKIGQEAKPFIDQGLLVPDRVVNDLVAELFRDPTRPEKFVTDGYPRTEAQANSFDALLRQEFLVLTAVIHLTISDKEVERRMLARGRDDDNEETIRQRLKEFHKNNDALVKHYRKQGLLKEVPAVGEIEDIYQNILRTLGVCDQPKK
jgi:adenylate kinase